VGEAIAARKYVRSARSAHRTQVPPFTVITEDRLESPKKSEKQRRGDVGGPSSKAANIFLTGCGKLTVRFLSYVDGWWAGGSGVVVVINTEKAAAGSPLVTSSRN
jgi:hypothetical protein